MEHINVPRSPIEHEKDPKLDISICGHEKIIAKALEEFKQNTFHNYWEYLLVLLEMPVNDSEYEKANDFCEKVHLILNKWTELYGEKATVNEFNYHLRNHRTITSKIRNAVLNAVEEHEH